MSRFIAASVMALTLGAGAIGAAGQVGDALKKTGEVTKSVVTETGKATKKGVTKTKNAVTGEARAKCKRRHSHGGQNPESRKLGMCQARRRSPVDLLSVVAVPTLKLQRSQEISACRDGAPRKER